MDADGIPLYMITHWQKAQFLGPGVRRTRAHHLLPDRLNVFREGTSQMDGILVVGSKKRRLLLVNQAAFYFYDAFRISAIFYCLHSPCFLEVNYGLLERNYWTARH